MIITFFEIFAFSRILSDTMFESFIMAKVGMVDNRSSIAVFFTISSPAIVASGHRIPLELTDPNVKT